MVLEPKEEKSQVWFYMIIITVGLMILVFVAMALIAVVAISALRRRRTAGQLSST